MVRAHISTPAHEEWKRLKVESVEVVFERTANAYKKLYRC